MNAQGIRTVLLVPFIANGVITHPQHPQREHCQLGRDDFNFAIYLTRKGQLYCLG